MANEKDDRRAPPGDAGPGGRRAYSTPRLIRHGTIEELTLSAGLQGTDMPFGGVFVGSRKP